MILLNLIAFQDQIIHVAFLFKGGEGNIRGGCLSPFESNEYFLKYVNSTIQKYNALQT